LHYFHSLRPLCFLLAVIAIASSLQSQTTLSREPAHGTINILIGSKYGLVAETDSMLSNGQRSIGLGQKLFKIDDQTICTIADFYSDPGPQELGNRSTYPLATSIPAIFASYVHSLQSHQVVQFDTKVKWLTEDLIFNLQLLADIERLSGSIQDPHGSTLTVAGYDNGKLQWERVRVEPIHTAQGIIFGAHPDPKVTLATGFSYITAGMDDVAKEMLTNKNSSHSFGNPELAYLHGQLRLSDVASSDLNKMEAAESKIVDETATFHSVEVGGSKQIAILAGGQVAVFQEPIVPPGQVRRIVNTIRGGREIGSLDMPYAPESLKYNPNILLVVVDFYCDHVLEHLDNHIFAHSFFIDTVFRYDGYGLSVLDDSDVLIDCTLIVGPGVAQNDSFVASLGRRYPDLRIERAR
jgi:hypothetical protein